MAEWWQGPINLGVMSLDRFSNFAILSDFSGTMKARKLKVHLNMDNDGIWCVLE